MADAEEDTTTTQGTQATESTPFLNSNLSRSFISPESFQWFHYLFLVILACTLILTFLSTFSSIWTFLFINGTFLIIVDAYYRVILPLKPEIVKLPFMLSQTTYATFLSPLFVIVSVVVIYILLGITESIIVGIIFSIFFHFYPEAAKVFADDISAMNTDYPTFNTASYFYQRASVHTAADVEQMNKAKLAFMKLWGDMTEAGASPIVMALTIALIIIISFLLFVVVGGLASTAALEHAKWNAFKRHKTIPSLSSINTDLGVSGAVFVAATGATSITTAFTIMASFGISHSFYAGLIFMCTCLLDACVVVGSMIMVSTAYAEKEICGRDVSLRAAFKNSISYTFIMYLLRVAPPTMDAPQFASPIIVFVLFTGLRAFFVFNKSKKFMSYYEKVSNMDISESA